MGPIYTIIVPMHSVDGVVFKMEFPYFSTFAKIHAVTVCHKLNYSSIITTAILISMIYCTRASWYTYCYIALRYGLKDYAL